MSNSLWPHGLQHSRLLCPPLSPRVYSNSCPLSWSCYLTISSSATPFSFWLQTFPASGSFLMTQFFKSGGQSIGASASVLPMNLRDWFPFSLTGWISLLSKGFSRVYSSTTVWKAWVLWCSAIFMIQLSHMYRTTGKTIALTMQTFVSKVMSAFFNMLSRSVIVFLPRSKHLLISWLHHNRNEFFPHEE